MAKGAVGQLHYSAVDVHWLVILRPEDGGGRVAPVHGAVEQDALRDADRLVPGRDEHLRRNWNAKTSIL